MDEVIWVEILSKHGDVAARYRCNGPEIRIGRGYDNDVVVDDPYVAPSHIRIMRDENNALIAMDLGSANGLFSGRGAARMERIAIDDEPIRIGRTYLRICEATHRVAPERVLKLSNKRSRFAVFYLTLIILGIQLISAWLGEVAEPKISDYAYPILGTLFLTLGWTASWTILSRVFSSHANFEPHLRIALKGALVLFLWELLVGYAAFSFSWSAIVRYAYIATWFLFAAICFFHLRVIGWSRLKLKGSMVAVLAIIGIATQTLAQSEDRSGNSQQNYVRRLKPPVFRLIPQKSGSDFFLAAEQLKGKLDKARTEESTSDGSIGNFDSDD